jgi:hydrogenase expression/formation protein HypE
MSSDSASSGSSGRNPVALPAATSRHPTLRGRDTIAGGRGDELSAELLERLALPSVTQFAFEPRGDPRLLTVDAGRMVLTTDSFVVTPIFFPGGDIGELAINGTINDLVIDGARPLALSVALILEEGFRVSDLRRVIDSVRAAAERVRVPVVTADRKVVGYGERPRDGIFVNVSGLGIVPNGRELGTSRVVAGDAVIVSGTIGDHGIAVLVHRENLSLGGELRSDTAPLHNLVETLLERCPDVHAMRSATRGGLAAALVEVAGARSLGVDVDEASVPMHEDVRATCELLGLDPWTVVNEGKLVVFVPESSVATGLEALRSHPLGRSAKRIATVTDAHPGAVVAHAPIGTNRIVSVPFHDPLPRTC